MKRTLVLLAIAALVLPATALGKGPASAEIQGPGAGGINLSGGGENFGTPLGDLVQYAGFFPAMFRQTPDPMSDQRPQGDLGPKYTVTYSLPGPDGEADTVTQELYPYANPPVSYTKPGQEFFEAEKSRGGWYVSTAALRERRRRSRWSRACCRRRSWRIAGAAACSTAAIP